ncbi:hypothetical protein [Azospirillum sp. sgz302134]
MPRSHRTATRKRKQDELISRKDEKNESGKIEGRSIVKPKRRINGSAQLCQSAKLPVPSVAPIPKPSSPSVRLASFPGEELGGHEEERPSKKRSVSVEDKRKPFREINPAEKSQANVSMYRSRRKQQKILSKSRNFRVSGKTHQAEHVIGYNPLVLGTGLARPRNKKRRDNSSTERESPWQRLVAKRIEDNAPAYQEILECHRSHIGTGNKTDESGSKSAEYRKWQRAQLESGNPSAAIQLNQLYYAHQRNFQEHYRGKKTTTEGLIAHDSYDQMVENMTGVEFASKSDGALKVYEVPVSAEDKAEMSLARKVAETGKWEISEEDIEREIGRFDKHVAE